LIFMGFLSPICTEGLPESRKHAIKHVTNSAFILFIFFDYVNMK
jgi:hypothetical protein